MESTAANDERQAPARPTARIYQFPARPVRPVKPQQMSFAEVAQWQQLNKARA